MAGSARPVRWLGRRVIPVGPLKSAGCIRRSLERRRRYRLALGSGQQGYAVRLRLPGRPQRGRSLGVCGGQCDQLRVGHLDEQDSAGPHEHPPGRRDPVRRDDQAAHHPGVRQVIRPPCRVGGPPCCLAHLPSVGTSSISCRTAGPTEEPAAEFDRAWVSVGEGATMLQQPLGDDFDEFVRAASPRLVRTAYLLVGDLGHAEDLVQTALVRTARRWRDAKGAPTAYARAVLVNLVKDRRRSRLRRVVETPLDGMPPAHRDPAATGADVETIVLRDALVRATRALPPRQRAVLVLRYFEDLPVEQVAEILGCSTGTVKSQTHHALVKLRELIAAPAGAPTPAKESDNVAF